jgi:hypothetical protein
MSSVSSNETIAKFTRDDYDFEDELSSNSDNNVSQINDYIDDHIALSHLLQEYCKDNSLPIFNKKNTSNIIIKFLS